MSTATVAEPTGRAAGSRAQAAFSYQPALDGLRAFAVLAVMLYHLGLARARGGFLGVDVFFVISGFLITTLLLRERASTGRISLRGFWLRRARRLLPAVLLLLVGVSAYAWAVADATELGRIRGDAFASLFYVQNWRLIFSGQSYFEAFAAPSPLRHLWSLAIEEQFYLVWPLALGGLLVAARRRTAVVVAVVTIAAAASALAMRWMFHPLDDPSRVYYGTDTRAHTLLVGVLLALVWDRAADRNPAPQPRRTWAVDVAGLAGLALLLWAVVGVADTSAWLYDRFGFLLVALAAAALVAASLQPTGVVCALFALPPLPWIGRLSYGLYLWHWPVYVVLTPQRVGRSGLPLDLLRVAVTFSIAIASYHLVERPLRFGGWRAVRRVVLVPTAYAVVIAAIALSTAGARTAPTGVDALAAENPLAFAPDLRPPDGVPRVLMVGDSVAFTLGRNAPDAFQAFHLYTYGRIGCGVLRGDLYSGGRRVRVDRECAWWPEAWKSFVDLRQPDLVVVMVGAWEVYDHVRDGHVLRVATPEYDQVLRSELERAVDILAAGGARVAFFDVPCFREAERGLADRSLERNDPARVAVVNRVIAEVARDRPEVAGVLPLGDLLCPGGDPPERVDGKAVRYDGVHFSPEGARLVWDWLTPRLEALLPGGDPVSVARWNGTHPDDRVEAPRRDPDGDPPSAQGGDRPGE